MSFLVPKLRKRVVILKSLDTPNAAGGYTRSYERILDVWAEMKLNKTTFSDIISSVRGSNVAENKTNFMVRSAAVKQLGKSFSKAFDNSSDTIANINPIDSEYFIFVKY